MKKTQIYLESSYLDFVELSMRGWSDAMVRNLLGDPDTWLSVDHFANFSGKRAYYRQRVEAAEATEAFRAVFARSARRRKLAEAEVGLILERSLTLELAGAKWPLPRKREREAAGLPAHKPTPIEEADITSAGVPWSEVPDFAKPDVAWIDGRGANAQTVLPGIDEIPIPEILELLPVLHENRPLGSKAMLDAAGARSRLAALRPGAWLISPFTGWKWAVWPDCQIGWLPADIILPTELRVGSPSPCNNESGHGSQ
jgi:hypothetical protein